MSDPLLVLVIAAAFAGEQWWTRRKIRRYFAERGKAVTAIRWLAFKPLASLRYLSLTWVFRVHYLDSEGRRFACEFVSGFWDGFYPEGSELEPAPEPAPRSESDRKSPAFYLVAAGCAALACLSIGLAYWTAPYGKLNLPDALYGPGLVAIVAFSFLLSLWEPGRPLALSSIMTGGVIAVIFIRAAMDVRVDPTSHNLFGIEVVIGFLVGEAAAWAGVLPGWALAKVSKR